MTLHDFVRVEHKDAIIATLLFVVVLCPYTCNIVFCDIIVLQVD